MIPARISVVVISRNEGDYVKSTIDQLQATLRAGSDIVVVDDGSVDHSCDFLVGHPHVRLIVCNDLGVARANVGARQTSGDIIFFADRTSVSSLTGRSRWQKSRQTPEQGQRPRPSRRSGNPN